MEITGKASRYSSAWLLASEGRNKYLDTRLLDCWLLGEDDMKIVDKASRQSSAQLLAIDDGGEEWISPTEHPDTLLLDLGYQWRKEWISPTKHLGLLDCWLLVWTKISSCRKPPRYVPYKGTYVPNDGTYGASDQGQTLDVWGWHPDDVNPKVAVTLLRGEVTTSALHEILNR